MTYLAFIYSLTIGTMILYLYYSMNVLFIAPYPTSEAPSQRFRYEQYFRLLEEKGYTFKTSTFIDSASWKILYKPGHFFKKIMALLKGNLRRIGDLLSIYKYDVVFIHREVSPFGPALFVWIVTKVFRKYTIYDFDDAIWIPNASESNSKLTMLFKRFSNVKDICKWVTVVSVGNKYLAEFASQYNRNVVINPTTIETDGYHNLIKDHNTSKFVIGWTGSHSTLKYLNDIFPVILELEKSFDFEFHVIADVPPKLSSKSLKFVPWNKNTEINDLLAFNIGIMPLPDDVWSKGKCGFKALQYMALGIPAIVSNVGVNAEIVDHGKNGYICKTNDEWFLHLKMVLTQPALLKELSSNTRSKVVDYYSVKSNSENFLKLFKFDKND